MGIGGATVGCDISAKCPVKLQIADVGFEKVFTLPEINMAPENGWLEDEFPFGMAQLQVLC